MPIKILAEFLVDVEKLTLKFIQKDKGAKVTKTALNMKDKVGRF